MTYTRSHQSQVIDAVRQGESRPIYEASLDADNDQLSKTLYWLALEVEQLEGNPELLQEKAPAMMAKVRHYCKPEAEVASA